MWVTRLKNTDRRGWARDSYLVLKTRHLSFLERPKAMILIVPVHGPPAVVQTLFWVISERSEGLSPGSYSYDVGQQYLNPDLSILKPVLLTMLLSCLLPWARSAPVSSLPVVFHAPALGFLLGQSCICLSTCVAAAL